MSRHEDILRLRAAMTTQALATMGVDAQWDELLTEYLCLDGLHFAETEFGREHEAGEKYTNVMIDLEHRYGKHFRSHPCAEPIHDEAQAIYSIVHDEVNQEVLCPYWSAGAKLAAHPAPTLAAALFKTQVIFLDSIMDDPEMTRNAMDIVREDFSRFRAV